jgi:reprolysin-like metallo-peptidase family M12B
VGNDVLSVATTFIGRPTLMHITVDGETYFVSPEGDHYVVAPTKSIANLKEAVRYPAVSSEQFFAAAAQAATNARRRAVRSGPDPYRYSMQGVLATSYLQAVNERDGLNDLVKAEQIARDRMQHAFDYTNAALANSSYYQGRWYLRQVVVREVDQADPSTWAQNASDVQALRASVHAAGTFIMAQQSGAEAVRNSPGKVNPKVNVAIAGSYFASWDDGDMRTTAHELGHTLGMDHNWQSAPDPAKDSQWYARAKYDCTRKVRDLMSYNPCGEFLTTLPIYSGPQVIWNGGIWGSEAENNVRAAVTIGPFLDEGQITN